MTKAQQNRAENELVFRSRNNNSSRLADEILDDEARETMPLNFICECSDEHCQLVVEATFEEYRKVRRNDKHFLLAPGHEQTDIEKVVRNNSFTVVEKFSVPSRTDGRLNQTS